MRWTALDTALRREPRGAQLWWHKGNALLAIGRAAEALAGVSKRPAGSIRAHGDAAYRCGTHPARAQALTRRRWRISIAAQRCRSITHRTLQMRAVVLKELDRPRRGPLADAQRAIAPRSGAGGG